jgi:peptidyl-prolyl cis-trans isomerase A (cyclophilin A)
MPGNGAAGGLDMRLSGPLVAVVASLFLIGAASQGLYRGSHEPAAPPKERPPAPPAAVYPTAWVVMSTSMGEIAFELYGNETPVTTGNFINLAKQEFYSRTLFHRVVKGFVIQGGGFTVDMVPKPSPFPPIRLEMSPMLNNSRGTISMARTSDPDSATTQFFINLVDNSWNLGPKGYSPYGYAVFGRVILGMEVVDAIASVTVKDNYGMESSLPVSPMIIESVSIAAHPPR